MHHRHSEGGHANHTDIDADRFFRAIDRAVLETYSKPSALPLVLASLPEHHHLFHKVSQNPYLVIDGVHANPDSVKPEELRPLSWRVMEPRYKARLNLLCHAFEQAQADGRGSDSLSNVAETSATGRVATLLVEADRHIHGHLNESTDLIEPTDPR